VYLNVYGCTWFSLYLAYPAYLAYSAYLVGYLPVVPLYRLQYYSLPAQSVVQGKYWCPDWELKYILRESIHYRM
jgi:hypothetical protein